MSMKSILITIDKHEDADYTDEDLAIMGVALEGIDWNRTIKTRLNGLVDIHGLIIEAETAGQ